MYLLLKIYKRSFLFSKKITKNKIITNKKSIKFQNFLMIIFGEFYFTRFTHFFSFHFSLCFFVSRGEIPPHFIITHFTPFSFHFNTLSFYPFTLLKYPKHSEFSDNSHDYIYALFCILIHQTYVPNACSFTIYFL